MSLTDAFIYFLAALAGGAVNSVAGGGTFLTFPLLIINGVSPLAANIISTIALWPGSLASAFAYRKQLSTDRKTLVSFGIASVAGGLAGTAILLMSPEMVFEHMVPWLLLFATLLFTFGQPSPASLSRMRKKGRVRGAWLLQFLIAVYGGYFGAGIGILMLAMLQLMGLSGIHRMNALKTVLGSMINAVAVLIFILSGRVIWDIAAVMILGGISGGYFGTRLALITPPRLVRALVSIIGFTMALYFFTR